LKLQISIDGKNYEVEVEVPHEYGSSSPDAVGGFMVLLELRHTRPGPPHEFLSRCPL
jgi:hypothetical protein